MHARTVRFRLSLLVLLLVVIAAPATGAAQQARPMAVEDAFAVIRVSDPQPSPDGGRVAWVARTTSLEDNRSRGRIWMREIPDGEAWPLTAADSSASSPRWSPDGRRLAFLSSRGEDATQVWVLDLRGGEAVQVTEVKQGVSGFEWAPDSRRMVLVIHDAEPERAEGEPQPPWVIDRLQFKQDYVGYLDRRRDHLYVFDLDTRDLRQVTEGDTDDSEPVWSPDGSRIAFVSNRTDDPDRNYDTDVWVIDVTAAEGIPALEKVSVSTGADSSPVWSPDGSLLAWATTLRPEIGGYAMRHLAVARPGETPRVISEEIDRNTYDFAFDAGGTAVLGVLESEGAQHLVAFPVDGSGMRTVWGGERRVGQLEPMPGGGAVVTSSTAGVPAEVFVVDGDGEALQVSSHNADLLAELQMGRVVKERHTGPDGTELESFYTFPPDYREGERYPAILWIHGGPQGQDDWGFYDLRQLFAANGYVVVQTNYRGSHGYGQEFALGLWQDWGGPEPIDVVAGVDHGIERGWIDPERLGVGGWSYGGITTNGVITSTDRFEAAISGAGGALYTAMYGHDHYQRWYIQELGPPWENTELWEKISTFYRVANITTPTLWIGGEEDWNVPIRDGELMYQSMKQLGRDTLLVVYPDQHHGGFPPKYERDRYLRFLGWFGKYLKGDDSMWPR